MFKLCSIDVTILVFSDAIKMSSKMQSQLLNILFQLFRGNQDSHSVKISYLEHTARARFLRLHIQVIVEIFFNAIFKVF